ncbi:MAG: NAD(P)-dependent dehydrogenase (short-subunit alcohol dehydrogenase family) [Glaciecola sp.]|jgi:NAD(P)-dependent dehydrogenase (short-subunit alcohol dehydrogenase family)|uniref:SDR family oxidoreductase n=1 Tax=Congregibacter sp. TaxID=2744308 RepID=UPI0039E233A0
MSDRMTNKIVLVTGGGAGIGQAACYAFAREGAKLMVSDIDSASGNATVDAIREDGGDAHFVQADVSKAADVRAMVDCCIKTYGQLDCAFNNAGIEGDVAVPITEASEETWDRVIDVNLKSVFLCMKYQLVHMQERGTGSIVNTASIAGLVGGTFGAAYFASKHGVVGLTKAAAIEYGRAGIRVNAVCPGVIETDMADRSMGDNQKLQDVVRAQYPLRRFGRAEEVAESVVWLCSDAASFVTGQSLAVDGGFVAT